MACFDCSAWAANFWATGWYTESHQTRSMFGLIAPLSFPFAYRFGRRAKAPPSKRWFVLAAAKILATFTMRAIYNRGIRRFWREIGFWWRDYERSLPDER